MDSAGLSEIVQAYVSTENRGGSLRLVHVTTRLRDLLVITKLSTVVDTYDNEADALASFEARSVNRENRTPCATSGAWCRPYQRHAPRTSVSAPIVPCRAIQENLRRHATLKRAAITGGLVDRRAPLDAPLHERVILGLP